MKSIMFVFGSVVILLSLASISTAQVQRTFVSGLGRDSNPCSRTAPCRTFGQAIMGTSAGGEVVVLDSAGYGPVTISQAVSITVPPGVYAGISVFSGDGITVNAGGTDTIVLRGLTINNQGGSGSGIVFNTGRNLHIENCVVNGFSSAGVAFNGAAGLEVKDSIFRNNFDGIIVQPPLGPHAIALIDHVLIEGGSIGTASDALVAYDGSTVNVRNTTVSIYANGISCRSSTNAAAELNIENCVVSNTSNAITSQSTSTGVTTVRVSNSTVTDNGSGLFNTSPPAVLLSRGNNTVEGNLNNTVGTIGSYTAK